MEERPFEGRVTKRKKENNSTLPKAVAAERSSQATGITTDLDIFQALANAGQRLGEIQVHYEQQPEHKLAKIEKAGEKLDYRVTKMKLTKDKLPHPERHSQRNLRLSPRQPLRAGTGKRSGITNDPNRDDDPSYILRLIGQVITVSLGNGQNRPLLAVPRFAVGRPPFTFNDLPPYNPSSNR